MNRVSTILLRLVGGFCTLSWLLPFALYGIFNTGTAIMLLAGTLLLLLPRLWGGVLAPHSRLRMGIAAGGCAALVFCATISALMSRQGWHRPPPASGKIAVVVLGSKINGDQPSLMLQRRLDAGARYLAQNPAAVCVVSGGQGPDEAYTEAQVMRAYLLEMGVPDGRILVEDRSTNTRQNLAFSREVLTEAGYDAEAVAIATDGFHQLRASVFAAAEGLAAYSLPSLTPWGLLPAYWMREILGVSWAWLTTRF